MGALPGRVGQHGDGADADHLVARGGERDRGARHFGDPRAPDTAGDDDDFRLDGAGVRVDAPDPAGLDVDTRDLDAGGDRKRAHLLRFLAHQRSRLERIDDPDFWRVEAAEDDGLLYELDHRLDLGRTEQPPPP